MGKNLSHHSLKKFGTIFVFLLIFLFVNSLAFAHVPEDLSLEYEKDSQSLTVDITHSVPDPSSHYVKILEIRRNGNLIKTEEYDSQPEDSSFSYSFNVSAEQGDTLQVKAYCSLYGDISEEIEVAGGSDGGGINFLFLIVGLIVAAAVFIGAGIYYMERKL